jgi:hypothetical protein
MRSLPLIRAIRFASGDPATSSVVVELKNKTISPLVREQGGKQDTQRKQILKNY